MSVDTQRQIKENSTELNDFLQDLTAWEHTVKDKEKKLVGSANKSVFQTIPAVRGQKQSSAGKKDVDAKEDTFKKSAASHTYDYFKDKWDKFDVDAALAEVDEEPQKPSPKKVARTSKSKPAKVKVEEKEPPKLSVAPRASNSSYGGVTPRGSSLASLLDEGPAPDHMSEKDLGNEFFKEGKYVNAIECYSRSIALQPTAVAFANRAMALLKIRRYADAEVDCTEAISLDDRYTKAYSRRGTARKELQKYFAAVEDFEFALRLEPESKELKKQYDEAKTIYEKFASKPKPVQKKVPVMVEELSSPRKSSQTSDFSSARQQATDSSSKATSNSKSSKLEDRKPAAPPASSSSKTPVASSLKAGGVPRVDLSKARATPESGTSRSSDEGMVTARSLAPEAAPSSSTQHSKVAPRDSSDDILAWSRKLDASRPPDSQEPLKQVTSTPKQDKKVIADVVAAPSQTAVQPKLDSSRPSPTPLTEVREPPKQDKKVKSKVTADVVAPSQAAVQRAAMNVTAGLAKNMVAPKTSYEFEATWKGFANDRQSQSRLLKIMDPSSLPKVFKDLLGAPLLMDIMNSLPLLLPDDTRLVLRILENLVKVGRFDMTILFLTAKDKTVMRKLWDDISATEELSINEETKLNALRSKYKL